MPGKHRHGASVLYIMTITIYGADWCGDSRSAKAYFGDNGIAFDYVNAETTATATDIILERNGGVQRIPVIVFEDDSHLTEVSNDEIETKLAELADGNSYKVTKNTENNTFELHHNGEFVSYADFIRQSDVFTVPHVTTLPSHRGKGNAGRLMDGVLRHVRVERGTIVPLCPFAASHIRDNPRWDSLVETES